MHSFVVAAGSFDVALVQGADAERFLQGQLTCDVAALADNHLAHGACCTNKGRVIATFLLLRQQDCYYLCMTQGVAKVLLETLRKYLPFYKQCTLTVPEGQVLTAHAGDNAEQILQSKGLSTLQVSAAAAIAGGWLCRLAGTPARVLYWATPQAGEIPATVTTTLEQWEALGMLQGEYPFRAEDAGVFTPQELHLDRNDYISFSKGCYTGQEIVARMHYRGKQKRALYLAILSQPLKTVVGESSLPVTAAGGDTIGRCLLVRPLAGYALALLELPVDFAGPLTALAIMGTAIRQGCLFEPTVIQSANLQMT